MPEEKKSILSKHPVIGTLLLIVFLVGLALAYAYSYGKYLKKTEDTYKAPVFVNESFEEVDKNFNVKSTLTNEEQDRLFKERYQYNAFKWTCRPLGCTKILGKTTLKLVCRSDGFTEDLRLGMKEDCTDAADLPSVTVTFQLLSKTEGEYYVGRAGQVAG
jgi:hypothetical protein